MSECQQDFLATELLSELKEENNRKDSLIKRLCKIIAIILVVSMLAVLVTMGGFLWYLNQYDFTSEQTVSGVYALVDSEGNVIATDFTEEEMLQIMEVLNNGERDNEEVEN